MRFARATLCVILTASLGAAAALARPEHGAPPALVDAAVWDAVAGGPQTFLVRLRDSFSLEQVAGSAPRKRRSAVADTLRAAGLAKLAVLDDALADLTRAGHVSAVARFPVSGVVAVRGDDVAVSMLAAVPAVAEVRPDAWRRLADGDGAIAHRPQALRVSSRPGAEPGAHVVADRADEVWRRLGVTGEGVVVAVIDTGADWTHPQLVRAYRGRDGRHDYAWWDATGAGADRPVDVHGHGTTVTGVVVGADWDTASGLAPGAEWIAVRAFDRTGSARDSWLLAAAEWVLAPTDRHGAHLRPDLAPDVVNASWVLENGADPLYRPVVAAWRAAGILPVFAAGNDERGLGPGGSILAPASYREAVGVGGSEADGSLWGLSLGGPSFYGGVKPDALAPAEVWGPATGGGLTHLVGTSAAAPQVSATAALMRAANPDLTPADLALFLGRSARDGGPPGPDDRFGHGLLDAFAAVRMALDAGRLAGRATDADGRQLPAVVTLTRQGVAPLVVAAPDGAFDAAVPAGDWRVRIDSFAHLPAEREVRIEPEVATRLDPALAEAPTWNLAGSIRDERGRPLAGARVAAFSEPRCTPGLGCGDGPPDAQASADSNGRYELALPAGNLQVAAAAPGHRTRAASLRIPESAAADRDFALPSAPRIALVDADADLDERIAPYLLTAIREAGFDADVWSVDRNLGPGWPPFGYDMVVWSHIASSPGKLDQRLGGRAATDALTAFVRGGGRLLATGQDVATLDAAAASPVPAAPDFVRDVLRARHVAGASGSDLLTGRGPFAGIAMALDLPLGYRWGRGRSPDVVAASEEPGDRAETVMEYGDGSAAAVASAGADGRRMFLAFGPEGAGPPAVRAELLGRAVEWLGAPDLTLAVVPARAAPGSTVRIAVEVLGAFADTEAQVELGLPLGLEPTGLYEGFQAVPGGASWAGSLPGGATLPLALEARVAPGFSGALVYDVTARLRADAAVRQTVAGFRPLSPGFDDTTLRIGPDRLQEGEEAGLALVLANTSGVEAAAQAVVTLPASLAPEPATVGASAGTARLDGTTLRWDGLLGAEPVTVTLRARAQGGPAVAELGAVVTGGGVLFETPASVVRIGGPQLTGALALSASVAEPGDVLTATLRVVNRGALGARAAARLVVPARLQALGPLEWQADVSPGSVLEVPFGLLVGGVGSAGVLTITAIVSDGLNPPADASPEATLTVRAPDLRGSWMDLQSARPVSGSLVRGSLALENAGDAAAAAVAQVALPPALSLEPGTVTVTSGTVAAEASGLRWEVQVPAGEQANLAYDALVARALAPNSLLAVTAMVASAADQPPDQTLPLAATIRANRLELAASSIAAQPRARAAGGRVAFLVTLQPTGDVEARDLEVDVRMPPALVVDGASLEGGVEFEPSMGTLTWRGRLGAGLSHRLAWTATLDEHLQTGARAIARGVIRTPGVDDVDLAAVVRVTGGDFAGSSKLMTPAVAGRLETVQVVLRAVNAAPDESMATIIDALPDGLVFVPGSAQASYGTPLWDESSRSLRWQGRITPHSAVEVRFAARMESTTTVTNVLQVADDSGTRFAAWAEVAPRRATVFLPAAARP